MGMQTTTSVDQDRQDDIFEKLVEKLAGEDYDLTFEDNSSDHPNDGDGTAGSPNSPMGQPDPATVRRRRLMNRLLKAEVSTTIGKRQRRVRRLPKPCDRVY